MAAKLALEQAGRRAPSDFDEAGARPHERVAAAQKGEVDLGLGAAVAQGRQQRWVEAAHPGEVLGVDAVRLRVVGVDQAQLARVGHNHLVPELGEQATHPGRVGAGLEHDAQGFGAAEAAAQRLRPGGKPCLLDDLTGFVDEAHLDVVVAEIETHGQLRLLALGSRITHGQPPSSGP